MNDEILFPTTPFVLQDHLILLGRRGSESHGLYVPSTDPNHIDDRDLMGIVVPPSDYYVGLKTWEGAEGIHGVWDTALYEVRKFVRLLCKQNPNVLSLLWTDADDILVETEAGSWLRAGRHLFRHEQLARTSFMRYAEDQLKKITAFDAVKMQEIVDLEQRLLRLNIDLGHAAEGKLRDPNPFVQGLLNQYVGMRRTYHKAYMGAKRWELVQKVGYDCYLDDETEFLTEDGWKHFDDVEDRKLATLNVQTGLAEFQVPVGRTDAVSDENLLVFEPHSSRAVVTQNHNMLVSPGRRSPYNDFSVQYDSKKADWGLQRADDLISGYRSIYHIRRAPDTHGKEYDVEDKYLALAGLYLSEGCTQYRSEPGRGSTIKGIRFTQTKPGPFFEAADELMAGYPIRRHDYEKETVWAMSGPTAMKIAADFGHKDKKHLPSWCFSLSTRQAEILWHHLMLGDGTAKAANDCYYSTLSKLAGDIQAAMVMAGLPCTVYGPYNAEGRFGPVTIYHVVRSNTSDSFHALNAHRILGIGEEPKERAGYPIKVIEGRGKRIVCFDVPNSVLITRSRGKVAIHGNSKNAAHMIRLLHMGYEYLTTGEVNVRRTWDRETLLEIKRGLWSLEAVKAYAEGWFSKIQGAPSVLPRNLNTEAIEVLVQDVVVESVQHLSWTAI